MNALKLLSAMVVLGPLAFVPALAQDAQIAQLVPPDVLDLKLGDPLSAQPGPFREFACGTNGGPPAQALKSFDDFRSCPVERETGLYEVTFRYDDEIEYYALAMNLTPIAERYAGTRFGSFPIIASVLVGEDGTLHGYRVVTDDRVSLYERRAAYTMGILAKSRIGGEWSCEQFPLEAGETAVGRNFLKEACVGQGPDGQQMTVRSRFFHRKGQTQIDRHSGAVREGLFESTTRLEVFDAAWEKP